MLGFVIGLAVLVADQAAKQFVLTRLLPGEHLVVIPNVFHITHSRNPGAAFGLLAGQTSLLLLITGVILAGVVWYLRNLEAPSLWLRAGIGLVVGGALGNLVDRIRFGTVVDFLDFRLWPVFNLADVAIVVGGVLLGWHILTDARSKPGVR